ncbi:MAG TPA: MutH/Sau3AI family endonuclease [Polyangiales bacterium]|nr:MutH/Sau3AI family endonuclease [Polyangiales bacterium]
MQSSNSQGQTLEALLKRAAGLAGRTLGEISLQLGSPLPAAPAKGHVGRLIERALGACGAGVTDFPECELKTLPVDVFGRPKESTFVCHVQLTALAETSWEVSRVRAKLARVLFMPIECGERLAQAQRRVGQAFLWEMGGAQEALLRDDYLTLADRVAQGEVEHIDARWGRVLQLRPKAAHSGVRVRTFGLDGSPQAVLPRAFYLRTTFTHALLRGAGLAR